MKQAIIYTRFSPRPNAKDCVSCERQFERCDVYCARKGYDAPSVFEDKAVTGGILDRPGLGKAINALQPGDVLVVDRTDRLARDMLVNLTIRHQVDRREATIEYADGSSSDCTPDANILTDEFGQCRGKPWSDRTVRRLIQKHAV